MKQLNQYFRALIFFLLVSLNCFAQEKNPIYDIEFHFGHSRRIPYAKVDIKIVRRGDHYKLFLKSSPRDSSGQWNYSKKDTSFVISKEKFDELVKEVESISCTDIVKDAGTMGFDGNSCEIMFGSYGSSITYKIWSPEADTRKRNLNHFLNACNLILKTAGLKPDDILEK